MAAANFFIQNNVTSTSDSHSRWKFIKDSGDNWTLTMPKNFGSALYVGVFVKDDAGNNITGLSEGVNAVSSDPTIVSVSNVGGHGFQLGSKGVVGTCYLTVTIPGTPDSVIPNGMTKVVRITTTNLAVADWQNMSPILDHYAGAQLNVSGFEQHSSDVSVSAGQTVDITGEKYVEIHSGDVKSSTGSHITVQRHFSVSVSGGEHIDVKGRLGASYLEFSSPEVDTRYIKDLKNGSYDIYMVSSQKSVDFTTTGRPGEPHVDISDVSVMFGDSVSVQRTGNDTFRVVAEGVGESQIMIETETGEGQTLINIQVLDEYPDTVLVKNGVNVDLDDHLISVRRRVLLNNNANTIQMDASVVFTDEISVSNSEQVVVSKDFHIFLSVGSQTTVDGSQVIIHGQKIDNGSSVQIQGSVIFTGNAEIESGTQTDIVTGHLAPTSNSASTELFGWKEQPHNEIVVSGADVNVTTGHISVNVPSVEARTGFSVNIQGIKPEDIHISNRMVTSVFRGIQVEKDNVVVENTVTIELTGVKEGGNLPSIDMTLLYDQSLVQGREFVKGQITEIPEISLDSYVQLGVKLYSYDNTLLNPSTFASAYFTIGDEALIFAKIDPVKSIIETTLSPDTLSVLTGRRVYDMNLHVVDKQGNPSIVLTRKLRFI